MFFYLNLITSFQEQKDNCSFFFLEINNLYFFFSHATLLSKENNVTIKSASLSLSQNSRRSLLFRHISLFKLFLPSYTNFPIILHTSSFKAKHYANYEYSIIIINKIHFLRKLMFNYFF